MEFNIAASRILFYCCHAKFGANRSADQHNIQNIQKSLYFQTSCNLSLASKFQKLTDQFVELQEIHKYDVGRLSKLISKLKQQVGNLTKNITADFNEMFA